MVTDRESLRGLSGVVVLVEDLDDDAKRTGLTEDQIQTDVELKLRLAGIEVLSTARPFPHLYVRMSVLLIGGFYPCNIIVELLQTARLERKYTTRVFAPTWSAEGLVAASNEPALAIRRYLGDYIDRFINAYLDVNPKR
jgi:hypothetical protein